MKIKMKSNFIKFCCGKMKDARGGSIERAMWHLIHLYSTVSHGLSHFFLLFDNLIFFLNIDSSGNVQTLTDSKGKMVGPDTNVRFFYDQV